jgi:hypothetical protein
MTELKRTTVNLFAWIPFTNIHYNMGALETYGDATIVMVGVNVLIDNRAYIYIVYLDIHLQNLRRS